MKMKRILLGAGLVLFAFSVYGPAFGYEVIGLSQPREWAGSGVRVQYYNPGRNEVASDLSSVPFSTTEVSYSNGNGVQEIGAWAQSGYKQLRANIYAEGYDVDWQTGGFYREQIRFTTYNNQPAELRMTLNLNAQASTYEGVEAANAMLSVGWAMYYGTGMLDYYLLSNQFPIATNNPDTWYNVENEQMTLKSTDMGYLIASGSYVPFSVTAWGTVKNGDVNWANTLDFVEFSVFQDGSQLSPDQFTIVEGVQFAAVPLPPPIILLVTGFLGMVGYRRIRR